MNRRRKQDKATVGVGYIASVLSIATIIMGGMISGESRLTALETLRKEDNRVHAIVYALPERLNKLERLILESRKLAKVDNGLREVQYGFNITQGTGPPANAPLRRYGNRSDVRVATIQSSNNVGRVNKDST